MKAYAAMLGVRFRMLLQYRAAAFAGIATQFMFGLIRMMIFAGFYASARTAPPMSLEHVIAYVWLGQAFLVLFPYRIDGEMEQLIRSGNVAYELLRPVDLYSFWFARSVANRTAPTLLRAVPQLVVATAVGWIVWPQPARLAAFVALLAVAVAMSAAVTMLMTVSMFWTISGRGMNMVINAMMWVFSGMIVPLPLYPDWAQPILRATPFRAMCDVPFRVFTGDLPLSAAPGALALGAAWAVALVLLGRWLLAVAARRLVVQGG